MLKNDYENHQIFLNNTLNKALNNKSFCGILMSKTEQLLNTIRQQENIMIAEIMNEDMKKGILECEMKRINELIPFINKGMEEAFQEEDAIILVLDNTLESHRMEESYDEYESTFTLQTESGVIIGETIYDEEELEDLRDDPSVTFVSDNFVTYNNLAVSGEKQFFLMSSTNSKFFTDADLESMVSSITVAIPSTETDHFIRDCFDLEHDALIGTLVVGFTE